MLPRSLLRHALRRPRFTSTQWQSARRTLVAAPRPNSGPLMERRGDRALPAIPSTYGWLKTIPIFLLAMAGCSLAIFNYQKSNSSVGASWTVAAQMARTLNWTAVFSIAWMSSSLLALAAATPTVTFPFNSQVPLVARKNQAYNYQLSSSTFQPQQGLTYTLSQQPAWLSINSDNLTLLGTPGEADVGSSTFTITAADETGNAHMQCTLVIAGDPAPQLNGDFSQQLAAETNLSSTRPPTVALTPGTNFSFHFQQDSFIDIVQRKLYYYATLTDHTPLPSWLQFDAGSLSFTGVAPQLSAFPQSFQISLIASDYQGFAGASNAFTLVIASQQLAIVPSLQNIRYSPGTSLNYSLAQSIFLNGKQLATTDLRSATATLPSWASFDAKNLVISGTAPQDGAQNGSVAVVDNQGNTAQAILEFTSGNSSVFVGTIGTITATAGQDLNYAIPTSVLDTADVTLSLIVPSSADWLRLDPSARIIHGVVPTATSPSMVQATLEAQASGMSAAQMQAFAIAITNTTTGSATSTDAATAGNASSSTSGLSRGAIAAIVVCSIIGTLAILALVFCCLRRRRRREPYVRNTPSPQKRLISGPTLISKHPDSITVTTQMQLDVEKGGNESAELADEDRPPQIALEIPGSTRIGTRASGISQLSSIGNGEDAIRRDGNIPEWGRNPAALHKPHDSFSIPTEIARASSRQSRSESPSKRALRRALERQSKQSIGLGIDTGETGTVRKKSSRVRPKVSSAGLSATLDRSSCASLSTQATSLLSTKPSDFPRPPTQSTFSNASRSIPAMSMHGHDKRMSIRMLRRSDSINDSRPLDVRRESFIRARASTSLQSPLFSHGSRNPLEARGRGSSSDINLFTVIVGAIRVGLSKAEPARAISVRICFPRVISGSEYDELEAVEDDKDEEWEDISPAQSRHQSSQDLAAEMAKPRHQRSWVLPGEASPTPPPLSTVSRRGSSGRKAMPESEARARWKQHAMSPSPAAYSNTIPGIAEEEQSPTIPKKSPKRRFSYVNEPIGLVSKDSFTRAKYNERPRLGDTKSSRPVSVEKVERLSSLKAEAIDALAGSEIMEEDEQGAGLMGPSHALHSIEGTHKSARSGKAFL
ncbi:hypothetical protein AMS68_003616 [Peltaster fructicola]|uniref:Dystroglycan-type cadherin-like domain-containing protein n=1 Tax=Peltaster fructicola TaxID=286661 RepID=A0A6H0XU07_9PEZI|nr:hypothetical protein AMS68_003616 [Peltaster fructicola]